LRVSDGVHGLYIIAQHAKVSGSHKEAFFACHEGDSLVIPTYVVSCTGSK
jgi:hypothetical protein